MRNNIKISEHQIQKSFFQWLSFNRKIRSATFSIPNGGFRNIKEASNLKATGVTAGVPDVMVAIPSKGYHGLFIEFKSAKGKQTDKQSEMFDILTNNGYKCVVCRSLEDSQLELKIYLEE